MFLILREVIKLCIGSYLVCTTEHKTQIKHQSLIKHRCKNNLTSEQLTLARRSILAHLTQSVSASFGLNYDP